MSAAVPLRVAVVGVGHLGRHHARLYAASPRAELVAVVDRDPARAREIAGLHGCEALDDPRALVGRVQAASVAVPTQAHCEVAVPLLDGGIDVLVEKPLARTLAKADAILDAAARGGRLVMVGHSERFNPAVTALARAVDAPRFFEIHRLAGFTERSTDIDVVLDLMIHDLDLLLYLDGTEAVSIDAVGLPVLTDKIDIANARLRLASGCVVNLTASRVSIEPQRRVRVFQARTYIACDTGARTVDRWRLVPGEARPQIVHDRLPVDDGEPLGLEIEAFLESVARRTPPPIDGAQGRRALALAHRIHDAIARSAAGG